MFRNRFNVIWAFPIFRVEVKNRMRFKQSKFRKILLTVLLFLLVFFANLLDALTTWELERFKWCVEANPITVFMIQALGVQAAMLLKVLLCGFAGVLILFLYVYLRKRPSERDSVFKVVNLVLFVAFVISFYCGLNNIHILSSFPSW